VSASTIAYVKSTSKHKSPISSSIVIDQVFVDKSDRVLKLMSHGKTIRSYHIALGDSPAGHKQQEGDQRTPVGIYTLDYKNENSIAHRSIHISYPNAADKAYAKKLGVSAGGNIMIHGQMNGLGYLAWVNQRRDWTDGCIAVTNDEMDEIMAAVTLGTPIEIVE
jgi:murein L,D-transpeptidase YafK